MVVSMDEYEELTSNVADDKIAAAEDSNKDDKIEYLDSIITEKDSKITILTNQIQSLEKDKDAANDERKELSRKLEDKDEALIKATALLTAYENQSWVDKIFNKKPKLKEAMDLYIADKGTVDAAAEVMDDDADE